MRPILEDGALSQVSQTSKNLGQRTLLRSRQSHAAVHQTLGAIRTERPEIEARKATQDDGMHIRLDGLLQNPIRDYEMFEKMNLMKTKEEKPVDPVMELGSKVFPNTSKTDRETVS